MTILCDWEILARCMDQKMVVPFDQKLINPASLDVRLGDHLMIETMYQEDLVRWTSQTDRRCPVLAHARSLLLG